MESRIVFEYWQTLLSEAGDDAKRDGMTAAIDDLMAICENDPMEETSQNCLSLLKYIHRRDNLRLASDREQATLTGEKAYQNLASYREGRVFIFEKAINFLGEVEVNINVGGYVIKGVDDGRWTVYLGNEVKFEAIDIRNALEWVSGQIPSTIGDK